MIPAAKGLLALPAALDGSIDRERYKEGDEEADRGNGGKTASKSGLALNGISYCGKLRTAKNGGSWL